MSILKCFTKINRQFILVVFCISVIMGCGSSFEKIGKFYSARSQNEQPYFFRAHAIDSNTAKPEHLGADGHNYYAWKLIKYQKINPFSENPRTYSSFQTVTEAQISEMSPLEIDYLRESGNLLINYLFFVDDHRCIYISRDDDRSLPSSGQIPIYFDDDDYQLEDKKIGKQTLRGYYYIEGETITFDFDGKKDFKMQGKYVNDKIIDVKIASFDSGTNLISAGLNSDFRPLDEIIDSSALPIFERPDSYNDIMPSYDLILGFSNGKNKSNPLHKSIDNQYSCRKINTIFYIESIKYDYRIDQPWLGTNRIYKCYTDCTGNPTYFDITESMNFGVDDSGDVLQTVDSLSTW